MHFNLKQEYFESILSGTKTAEGRIYKPKLHHVKVGDLVSFSPNDIPTETLKAKVTYIKLYDTFQHMLQDGEIEVLLPDCNDIEKGVKLYESFGNFKNDQYEHGVVSIGFKII